jgi:hypothetical protein
MLLEYFNGYKYSGVRTESDEVYVEWEGADAPAREYYDLKTDPYQLESAAGEHPLRESQLSTFTATFKNCSGASCREADGGP